MTAKYDPAMFLDKVKSFPVGDELAEKDSQQALEETNDDDQFDITQIEPVKLGNEEEMK